MARIPLLHDHDIAVDIDAAERDIDARKQPVHFLGDEAGDLVRSHHVIGMIERDGGGIGLRRDPFGVVGEECCDALGIA
nr:MULTISPECIES: hypothetical protein [Bradyrhizobium]